MQWLFMAADARVAEGPEVRGSLSAVVAACLEAGLSTPALDREGLLPSYQDLFLY